MTLTLPRVETKSAPVEKITKPKFSELIRLGSLNTEQAFEVYCDIKQKNACALGAGLLAGGMNPLNPAGTYTGMYNFMAGYGLFRQAQWPCEHAPEANNSFYNVITHLNDVDRWPRERIADWAESQGI